MVHVVVVLYVHCYLLLLFFVFIRLGLLLLCCCVKNFTMSFRAFYRLFCNMDFCPLLKAVWYVEVYSFFVFLHYLVDSVSLIIIQDPYFLINNFGIDNIKKNMKIFPFKPLVMPSGPHQGTKISLCTSWLKTTTTNDIQFLPFIYIKG